MSKENKIAVYNSSNYKFLPIKKIINYLNYVLKGEKKNNAVVNVVYVDKDEILKLNNEYLQHDYYTDVITFSLNEDDTKEIDGEIYICVDVAEEQAKEYKVSLSNELSRLAIHGLLHLCGYGDKTDEEQKLMRSLENKYLSK
jgi:rRNA maturation RNase YbeY